MMPLNEPSILLRRSLQANAWFSGISGCGVLIGAESIGTFLGLDTPWVIRTIGSGLLFYALWLGLIGGRSTLDCREVWTAVALDGAWVVGSASLLLWDVLPLTPSGKWALGIVGDIVAFFAVLQTYALLTFTSAMALYSSTATAAIAANAWRAQEELHEHRD